MVVREIKLALPKPLAAEGNAIVVRGQPSRGGCHLGARAGPGPKRGTGAAAAWRQPARGSPGEDDVIDLGAPRPPRRPLKGARSRHCSAPNPRLYPPRPRRCELCAVAGEQRARRRKRVFRRPVPNSRLYRPGPPRLAPQPPPPGRPRAIWPPPAPPAPRGLDTASHAALRLAEQRAEPQVAPPKPAPPRPRPTREAPRSGRQPARRTRPRSQSRGRRVSSPPPPTPLARARVPPARAEASPVVTLPTTQETEAVHYRPASEHFRLRSSAASPPAAMAAAPRRPSAVPEDGSDGNDSLSAPSEYLAEFLSAIMRRQYAEALKYCRLILQYEPHNATARGFYPLLRQKLDRRAGERPEGPSAADSSSEEAARSGAPPRSRSRSSPSRQGEPMEESADESGSAGSCSSLSLDSSREPSPVPASAGSENCGGSASTNTGAAVSTGSGTRSASSSDEVDDNGNAACPAPRPACSLGDVENDNAGGDHDRSRLKPELDSLQRLRAQFARSLHCAD